MNDSDIIYNACQQLAASDRGRNALQAILTWLDADGLGMDETNQEAIVTLLQMAWGRFPSSVRDTMRGMLASEEVNGQ